MRAHAGLRSLFETACKGLSISPEQLQRELSDDLDAIASGELTAHGLRQVAETLSACLPDPASERRRSEVLRMLRQHPEIQRAFVTDDTTDPEYVILTVAIRGKGICDLRIRRDQFGRFTVLQMIE